MHEDSRVLELVKTAINEGRIEDARTLLRPLMERNVVEAYYHASRVAYTQEQALEFLRYALLLEPENAGVKAQLGELEALYENRPLAIVPSQIIDDAPDTANRIKKTATLFKKHGWTLVSRDAKLAHLMRRRTMSAISAFIICFALNIPGFLLLLGLLLFSEKIHVFVEAEDEDILLTSSKGEQLISHPQQAIIMIEKYRGVLIWQGLLFGFIGLLIGTALYAYIGWQTQQNFVSMVESIQATLTAEVPAH